MQRIPLGRSLRVLLLEDSAADAELAVREIERSGTQVVAERVDSAPAFRESLRRFAPDVVLSDHALRQFNASAALDVVRQIRATVPLIVVAGSIDEHVAVEFLRAGVEDVVSKGSLHRLPRSIETALTVRRKLATLSPRQLEVLRLVAEGETTSQIARRLDIGVKTVESHRSEVLKRLGIHDIPGLVRYAVRVGLVRAGV